MDQITDLMKRTKQEWVASEPANTDLAIYLHFWRADDLVAMVQCPLDRDTGLKAGRVGAAGFGATTMSITFESYTTNLEKSPHTGEPWQPQEMQYTFEAVPENATEGWVQECLTTTAHDRGGGFCLTSLPYTIQGKEVLWGEEKFTITDGEDDGHGGGAMYEYLQNVMATPTIEEAMAEQAKTNEITRVMSTLVTDEEQRRFHFDMATFTALTERNLVSSAVFTAPKDSKRAEWIEERLGPGSTVQPGPA